MWFGSGMKYLWWQAAFNNESSWVENKETAHCKQTIRFVAGDKQAAAAGAGKRLLGCASVGITGIGGESEKKKRMKQQRNRSECRTSLFLKWPSGNTWNMGNLSGWSRAFTDTAAWQRRGRGGDEGEDFSSFPNAQKPLQHLDEAPVEAAEMRPQDDGFPFAPPSLSTRPKHNGAIFHPKWAGHV